MIAGAFGRIGNGRGTRTIRSALLLATALAAPAWASPALAQTAAEVDDDAIIVTAQRRAEMLEQVPMTVNVVTSESLAANNINNMRELANVTSGYTMNAGGGIPQPAIRGITTVINGNYENNIALYVDGLYQPWAHALNVDLPNLDNIQILKGPQGTLYGRNSTGGALLLTTITPGDVWQGKAEATYAKYNDIRVNGYVAGPINDRIGISIGGYFRDSDGYMKLASRTTPGATKGHATPIRQDGMRAKVKGQLTDALTATLAYSYTHINDSRSNNYSTIENVPSVPFTTRPAGATRVTRLGVVARDVGNINNYKQHEGGLTLDLDTGFGSVKSITGYSTVSFFGAFDFDGSYIPITYNTSTTKEKTFQQAVDLTVTSIENFDIIVGATYFHDKNYWSKPSINWTGLNQNSPGTVPTTIADFAPLSTGHFNMKKEAWAAYGDVTFRASDRLKLNLGGRYSEERQNVFGQVDSALAVLARAATHKSAKFSKFTPRASITYEVSPRTNIYASYSKGFRSGAFNTSLPANTALWAPARQESVDAFEVGFKTAKSGLRFEAAGFYYDYKDIQVSTTKTIAGFAIVDVTNAPKAKIYGLEGSFEIEPIENLTLRGSGTWLHARYGAGFTFGGVGVANSGTGGGVGINTNADPLKTYLNVSQIQDLSHLQMSRSPNFAAAFGVNYLIPNKDGGLRFAANVKYTDSYVITNPSVWGTGPGVPVDRQRQQRFREGAYALLSASITWTDPTDHYSLRLWGTNLTDHRYRLHYTGTSNYGTYSPMAEPRVIGATAGYKF